MLRQVLLTSLLAILMTGTLNAAEHEVGQKEKKFTVESLKVKIGDVVSFPNYDSFFHNIYSLSPEKIFDLGSYPQGQTKKVKFDKAGKILVECAIHPGMKMTIEVQP
ncbi:methylamine utilization protein [Leptospira stimsonii]|uniref:Methylamine utilization protein n=1 Tax=Leptospira stimsonii TaxID=2202203 RepID=A0A396YMF9_9LEPT|nr:methylamine utilization protein [Leptospira stimsonii]RHX84362.1 methylamine utilization protein [Leptospira stimsonii]